MTEPTTLRVFVNGTALSVEHGASVLDAVRTFNVGEAKELVAGMLAATDSRGLPVALDAPVTGGMVLRIVSARALRTADGNE
jgi:hypothetical protein